MSHLKMTPAKQFHSARFEDQNFLNAYMQQRYGMSSQNVEQALRLNASLAAGRMPEPEQLKWVNDQAKQRYGWNPDRVRAELNACLEQPTPEGRIKAYLHAGGNQVAPEMVREVIGLVESYAHTEMEQTVLDRVNANPDIAYRDNLKAEMPATPRVKDAAQDRVNLRDTIKSLAGDAAPVTYGEARQRIHRASLKLADRLDAQDARDMLDRANGREPQGKSLRDELAMAYDIEKVATAREAYGFGDIKGDAEAVSSQSAHLDDHFDVTEDIREL